mmetsp:Transcript_41745/g.87382  ORF Transcript_41745/g.87382 Transcript_41745/m.87382 type:complete len:287 (+) Transcript_41745:526-1386(+)
MRLVLRLVCCGAHALAAGALGSRLGVCTCTQRIVRKARSTHRPCGAGRECAASCHLRRTTQTAGHGALQVCEPLYMRGHGVPGRKQTKHHCRSLIDAHALTLFAINMGSFGSFYSFPSIGESFLHAHFGEHSFSPSASTLFALYYLVPIALAWPFGAMLGGAASHALHCCIAASCALMTCSFVLLASTTVHPAVGIFAIAAAYTLLCSSLPTAIAARFHPKLHGQAFGVWGCAQNGATLLIPVCIGAVADYYSITHSIYFLAGCTGVSTALSCALLFLRSTDCAMD